MEALVDVNAMEELANDFLARISSQIVRESAAEIASLNLLAKTTSLEIIFKSLSQERGAGDPQELYQIFLSLRDSNFSKVYSFLLKIFSKFYFQRKDKTIKFNFIDKTSLKDKVFLKLFNTIQQKY